VSAPFQGGADSNAAQGGDVPGPYDAMSRVLAELPRPRRVRMGHRGKMIAIIVSTALLASLGIFAASISATSEVAGRDTGPPQYLVFVLPIITIMVVVPVMLRTITQQRFLLAEGEIATAHVTKCWIARYGPNIRYEFTTPLGEHFSRIAADGTRQIAVGMNVPIFYDRQNPKKQLALCASLYEVVLPGDEKNFQ
jgi:hypothetical protein